MLLGANVHSSGTVEMKAKQLRRVYSNSSLELRQITREIDLLRTMKHDSIVDMREYFISALVLLALGARHISPQDSLTLLTQPQPRRLKRLCSPHSP